MIRGGKHRPSVAERQLQLMRERPPGERPEPARGPYPFPDHRPLSEQPEGPQAALGPALPPRAALYRQAREVERLAASAAECAIAGPRCDLARAQRKLDAIRAILGERG